MKTKSTIISNKMEQGEYTVSANKAIIETHVEARCY